MAATIPSPRTTSEAYGFLGLGGLQLTPRGRAVVLALTVLASALFGLVGTQAVASAPPPQVEVRVHTVAPGETLWHLARGTAAAGEDLRDVVAELKALNGMRTSELEAGQVVLLPAG